jgi:hypothetical protein
MTKAGESESERQQAPAAASACGGHSSAPAHVRGESDFALTLTQPWATLIAIGAKRVETRGWRTPYRGRLGIHAAKGLGPIGGLYELRRLCHTPPFFDALKDHVPVDGSDDYGARIFVDDLPRGVLLGFTELLDCVPTTGMEAAALSDQERAFGDYSPGRWAWLLGDFEPLPEPEKLGGALSLWSIEDARQKRDEKAANVA